MYNWFLYILYGDVKLAPPQNGEQLRKTLCQTSPSSVQCGTRPLGGTAVKFRKTTVEDEIWRPGLKAQIQETPLQSFSTHILYLMRFAMLIGTLWEWNVDILSFTQIFLIPFWRHYIDSSIKYKHVLRSCRFIMFSVIGDCCVIDRKI